MKEFQCKKFNAWKTGTKFFLPIMEGVSYWHCKLVWKKLNLNFFVIMCWWINHFSFFCKKLPKMCLSQNSNRCCLQNLLKACVRYFHQIFIFHQMIALQKLWKMLFISSKKLFSFSRYSIFCIFVLPSFSTCRPLL